MNLQSSSGLATSMHMICWKMLLVLGNQVSLTREKMGVMGFSSFCGWLFPGISCLLKINKRKFRQEMF